LVFIKSKVLTSLYRKWNSTDWTVSDDRVRGGRSEVS
jgi:hypothetical protein